mmetsp:Transcript_41309/g.72560  ORF Transcript_41309/g.72560 Transcript_41309/m.72560 type:complete len:236 (+) Transcript_41309:668-1375(+)
MACQFSPNSAFSRSVSSAILSSRCLIRCSQKFTMRRRFLYVSFSSVISFSKRARFSLSISGAPTCDASLPMPSFCKTRLKALHFASRRRRSTTLLRSHCFTTVSKSGPSLFLFFALWRATEGRSPLLTSSCTNSSSWWSSSWKAGRPSSDSPPSDMRRSCVFRPAFPAVVAAPLAPVGCCLFTAPAPVRGTPALLPTPPPLLAPLGAPRFCLPVAFWFPRPPACRLWSSYSSSDS